MDFILLVFALRTAAFCAALALSTHGALGLLAAGALLTLLSPAVRR